MVSANTRHRGAARRPESGHPRCAPSCTGSKGASLVRTSLSRTPAAAAAALVVALPGFATSAHRDSGGTAVVTESDVARQVENTTPTSNRVLYTGDGTPATAGPFVDGPAGSQAGSVVPDRGEQP